LSDEEAEALRQLQAATGESEEDVLRRAAVQGIRDLRLEQGIKAFKNGSGSGEAAVIAGLPRAAFFEILLDRGIEVLGPEPSLASQLAALGRRLGDDRLTKAAEFLASQEQRAPIGPHNRWRSSTHHSGPMRTEPKW
jgi:hypothetical protein